MMKTQQEVLGGEEIQEEIIESIELDALPDKKIGEKTHLKGKTVFIEDVNLKPTGEERFSKDGNKKMEIILFRLTYRLEDSEERYFENYGGVTRFIRENGEKSEPTINYKGKSAAANLFKAWLKFKGKEVEEVSFKDFFKGLKGMKARLREVKVDFQDKESFKNVVEKFEE